ncbi:GHMP family kinase ATP-binding protein [Desulfuribacillus alkaliarsenatis]|uniref:GHMP kinase N-terminal domain-containing protein n=1 Tax=Desulfuribacillus alkaliarsenatis TaxID=766136 RepID=A0A1E5G4G9_9FIRM|nr:hypothetical protein [Desulfuribacillus alkaliarsenatis]OEF97986.1 hypothetical protein BHF68_13035 [Desulfuribacillus alkaliarsenatis]
MDKIKIGTAAAPGTCGELVQGRIDGIDFLVTCPIDMWSKVSVFQSDDISDKGFKAIKERTEDGESASLAKVQRAISIASSNEYANLNQQSNSNQQANNQTLQYIHSSDLPTGKGMASSTADIVAAYTATRRFFGVDPTADELANVAISIEPSDGIMYPGITIFDHITGRWTEKLGEALNISIVIIDPGGTVDTIAFNNRRKLKQLNDKKETQVKKALKLIKEGVIEKDSEKLGAGATISAWANQEILPKPQLQQIVDIGKYWNALGVNVAHSGTVMGIFFEQGVHCEQEIAEYIRKKNANWRVYTTKMISGGVR